VKVMRVTARKIVAVGVADDGKDAAAAERRPNIQPPPRAMLQARYFKLTHYPSPGNASV
jgi:hypothetical protein